MNMRLKILKTFLWALVGVLAAVTVFRFMRGLGGTTALSDAMPWGFWNAFKIALVALAAGGFVLAASVYIFGGQKYRPLARPAVLTAFLGYVSFTVVLLYDLGLPWNIWHPIVYPQHHSVLFEVAMCVMLYLTVLFLEFAPVILEHRWFDRPLFRRFHKVLKVGAVPLVIAGIVLSTLHQSSLGSLFLITPYRLHPLWYSPIIWVLFLVSAVGLGLMVVTLEALFSAYFLGQRARKDLLAALAKGASVVLFVYAGLRLGDLALRGRLGLAFDGSWQSFVFLFELLLSALIPATLLSFRRVRTSTSGLVICAGMTALGIVGYRFNVCIIAFLRRMPYFPTWMELVIGAGILAGAMLFFIFSVERLKVYPEKSAGRPDAAPRDSANTTYSPMAMRSMLPDVVGAPRRYSLAAVAAAAATVALLPADSFSGPQLPKTPVFATRTMDGRMQARGDGHGHQISLAGLEEPAPAGAQRVCLVMIDGNRDGRLVLFPHDYHVERLAESERLPEQETCVTCHHLNMPFDRNTSCSECHRDMYISSDIFDHGLHVNKLGGNDGCAECHRDPTRAKTRATAPACVECHEQMTVADSMVDPPDGGMKGLAAGYMDAMHGLCITCHEQKMKEDPEGHGPHLADCANCHRDIDGTRFHQMKPYVFNRSIRERTAGTGRVVAR